MVHRDVEEPLNLRRMEVHEQPPVGSGGGEQIRDQLGRDGDPRTVFAVLPRVAVIRNHHRDAPRGGALQGVDHDEQLNQVAVHRVRGRLDHEHIRAAHVLQQLEVDLPIREALEAGFPDRDPDVPADIGRKPRVGAA